ncbi:MAG: hypothetical protein L6R30_11950 [Thermoanaerobaculia bacterium]|nr:hypothetical protein [Thermoanaerobaculia bacterium]
MSLISQLQSEIAARQAAHTAARPFAGEGPILWHGEAASPELVAYQAETEAIALRQQDLIALQAEAAELAADCASDAAAVEGIQSSLGEALSDLSAALGAGRSLAENGAFRANRYRELTGDGTYGTPATDPVGSAVDFQALVDEVQVDAEEAITASGGRLDFVTIRVPFRVPNPD